MNTRENNTMMADKRARLTENTFERNAANITISKDTRTLLSCRAKLCDIYETVTKLIGNIHSQGIEDYAPQFDNAFNAFDDEIAGIIAQQISCMSIGSAYKEV